MYIPNASFSSFLLLSLAAVHATPLSRDGGKDTLAITARINSAGATGFVEKERARLQSMRQNSRSGEHNTQNKPINVPNGATFYTASVGVGTPPTYHTLLVDTGSSNTWVGASQPYANTSSSVDTGNSVSVTYGSGLFFGEEWLDTVTLSSSLVITNQSIGNASSTFGFSGFDGILGLGPVALTQNTVTNTFEVPTITDNLFSQKTIQNDVLGVFFAPASESNNQGTLTFGGLDNSNIKGSVKYAPLTKTAPASGYWGIDQSVSYGQTTILSTTAGIVDTGTTLVYLATDAFQRYQNLTGGNMDDNTGLLSITSAQYAKLRTLSFTTGGTSYKLTPNAQIWPRSLNSAIGGSSGSIYLIVADIGAPSGSGFDFVNGYVFLERFYSVYDTANSRVGFARTIYTDSKSN